MRASYEGCGTKLELESNQFFEWPVEIVLGNARTTSLNSSLPELERIEDMTITIANSEHLQCLKGACRTVSASPAGKVQAWSLVVGSNPGSRAVVYLIPRVGLLGSDRRSQACERRRNEKNCNVKWRTTQLKDRLRRPRRFCWSPIWVNAMIV